MHRASQQSTASQAERGSGKQECWGRQNHIFRQGCLAKRLRWGAPCRMEATRRGEGDSAAAISIGGVLCVDGKAAIPCVLPTPCTPLGSLLTSHTTKAAWGDVALAALSLLLARTHVEGQWVRSRWIVAVSMHRKSAQVASHLWGSRSAPLAPRGTCVQRWMEGRKLPRVKTGRTGSSQFLLRRASAPWSCLRLQILWVCDLQNGEMPQSS